MAYGNTSASALINGANAARKRQEAYNDQFYSYEYQTSAQSEEDYRKYDQYLQDRAKKTSDPSKALALQSKRDSAYSSYTSNEIQRQTMSVMYGEQDNRAKYGKILPLYQQAIASGNMNLAQNLESTLASLSKTIQSEEIANVERARVSGERAARSQTKAYNDGLNGQLRLNKIAFDAIERAQNNNDILREADGTPIKGRIERTADGGQRIIYDDNAGTIKPTARQVAIAKAIKLKTEENLLSQAIEDGMDESGTRLAALMQLQSTDDYRKFTSAGLINALTAQGGGENPFTNRYDPVTRTFNSTTREVLSTNEDGSNVYRTGFVGDANDLNADKAIYLNYDKRNGINPTDTMDNWESPTFKMDAYNRQMQGVIRGKDGTEQRRTLYVRTGDGGILSSTRPGTIPYTAEDARSGKPVEWQDVLKEWEFNPAEGISETGRLLSGVAGGATGKIMNHINPMVGSIGNIVAGNRNAIKEKQRQVALAAAAAQAQQRAQAAAAALAAIPKVNPAAPIKVNYGAGTMSNVVGPRAIPAAVKQAAVTPATPQFTERFLPGAMDMLPAGSQIKVPTTPAPKKEEKPWWKFW